jgi:hypothetical protein
MLHSFGSRDLLASTGSKIDGDIYHKGMTFTELIIRALW